MSYRMIFIFSMITSYCTLDRGWIDVNRSIRWEFLKTFCWNYNNYNFFHFFRYIISQSWIAIYEYIIHLKLRRFRRASRNRDRRIITCKNIISIFMIITIIITLFIISVIINILIIKGHSPLHKSTASAESGLCWTSCGWCSPGNYV